MGEHVGMGEVYYHSEVPEVAAGSIVVSAPIDNVDKLMQDGATVEEVRQATAGQTFDHMATFHVMPPTRIDTASSIKEIADSAVVCATYGGKLIAKGAIMPPDADPVIASRLRRAAGHYWRDRGIGIDFGPGIR